MGELTEERRAATRVLRAVTRGRRLDRALSEVVAGLPPREKKWVQEAAYGTQRLRGRLDHLLHLHLKKGLGSLSPLFRDILRLGAYQLLYMDGVPAYAAISQTVTQVRKEVGPGAGKLANGVLRSLEREGGEKGRFPDLDSDPLGHLSTWGSHPSWLVERWLRRWSGEEVRNLVELNNRYPPLFLRPLGVTPSQAKADLSRAGYEAEEVGPGIPCLRLARGTDPARVLGDLDGIVQDPGAALVADYADLPSGGLAADLCAAPGGKAIALAERDSYVLAADLSLSRLRLLQETRARVGSRVDMVVADALHPPLERADFVLLDVPCSGTGTLRRHPDARWRLTLESLRTLVDLQRRILESGGGLVPPGGHLVYSTCTLESEENEEQVEAFLSRNPEFAVEETGVVPHEFITEGGYLSVLPQSSGFDGAFGARMVRRS